MIVRSIIGQKAPTFWFNFWAGYGIETRVAVSLDTATRDLCYTRADSALFQQVDYQPGFWVVPLALDLIWSLGMG